MIISPEGREESMMKQGHRFVTWNILILSSWDMSTRRITLHSSNPVRMLELVTFYCYQQLTDSLSGVWVTTKQSKCTHFWLYIFEPTYDRWVWTALSLNHRGGTGHWRSNTVCLMCMISRSIYCYSVILSKQSRLCHACAVEFLGDAWLWTWLFLVVKHARIKPCLMGCYALTNVLTDSNARAPRGLEKRSSESVFLFQLLL